jgi:hypothetical protein
MTTPLLLQSTPSSVVVYLELSTGLPATSLTFSDVTVGLKKEGGSFLPFPITALTWTNLGNGFYQVAVTASDTNTLGSLYFSFTGATIKAALIVARVAVAVAAPPTPPSPFTPTTTTIFGYIYDQVGAPKEAVSISVRTITMPTIIRPASDGVLISEGFVTARTDSTGFFSLDLLTGTQVEFVIPDANYRRVITVPSNASNLFDIP